MPHIYHIDLEIINNYGSKFCAHPNVITFLVDRALEVHMGQYDNNYKSVINEAFN